MHSSALALASACVSPAKKASHQCEACDAMSLSFTLGRALSSDVDGPAVPPPTTLPWRRNEKVNDGATRDERHARTTSAHLRLIMRLRLSKNCEHGFLAQRTDLRWCAQTPRAVDQLAKDPFSAAPSKW